MDGKSLDILTDKLNQLKEIIPEAFTEDKIDWEKLKATLGEDINFTNERYNLNWAGKSEAFNVLQQRTFATLKPLKDESVNFDETENVFIEGENLEVLKVLQKSYFGKIKMIYIDPPYNTGYDSFIYPDKFSETKEEYLKRIGEKNEEGYLLKEGFFRKNSKDSGHYHSNWLSMMYPRLYIARNLLRDDGVIFVSIDDNEVHNLRMIMNEIFGEENFIAEFVWKRRASSALAEKLVSVDHEYVLCYQKMNIEKFNGFVKDYSAYSNPNNDKRGPWVLGDLTVGMTKDQRPNQYYNLVDPKTQKIYPANPARVWAYIPDSMRKLLEEDRIYFPEDDSKRPMIKRFKEELKSESNPISTLLNIGMNAEATRTIKEIFDANYFSYSKPLSLVKLLTSQITNSDDIIIDFFAGSGTTAQAIFEINKEDNGNRKFILVQLPEKTDEDSEAYKANYRTIADICKERIRRVIKKIEKENEKNSKQTELEYEKKEFVEQDLGFKVFKLSPSNFKYWRSDIIETEDDLEKMVDLFDAQVKPKARESNLLYELILKAGYSLTDKIIKNNGWYIVADKLAIVLNKIEQKVIDEIIKMKPQTCIILDNLFADNDQLKTNTALQMKDAGVELVTI